MTEIQTTSEITVEYIQHMGDDAKLAHAAMVSTRGMAGEGKITWKAWNDNGRMAP